MAYYPGIKIPSDPVQIYFTSVREINEIGLQIKNVSGSALNSFAINTRIDSQAEWVTLAKNKSDFLAPVFGGLIAFSSGDPTTLAVGGNVLFGLDNLLLLAELQIVASAESDTVLDIFEYKHGNSTLSQVKRL